jgi:hypothetical protein
MRAEWKSLRDNFSRYSTYLYAHWTLQSTMPTKREWDISGANDTIELGNFAVLVEEAGNLLRHSDWIREGFRGINEPNPEWRWLNFICEMQNEQFHETGSGHVNGIKYTSGEVADLARMSSLVCAKLAAKEVWRRDAKEKSFQ